MQETYDEAGPTGRQMVRYVLVAAMAGAAAGWLAAWLQIPIN